jgi:dethiobiotin synthetase
VTGTDTAVGKTWVSCRLLEAGRRRGLRVAGLKAAESGAGSDQDLLIEAAGGQQTERCRFRFEPEVAPGVAADDLGIEIDFGVIHEQVSRLAGLDVVIVEGAGGWMVPMGKGRTIADLAVRLALPVLIVGRSSLGTINHSVLTAEAVERRGLKVEAVALSMKPGDDEDLARRNREEIAAMVASPVVLVRDSIEPLAPLIYGA